MKFEDFKEIYQNETPQKKLLLLRKTHDTWCDDARNATDAKWRQNEEERDYWRNECAEMQKRYEWLTGQIMDALNGRQGEWIEDEYAYNRCSECGYEWDEPEEKSPYCPGCGALMDDDITTDLAVE